MAKSGSIKDREWLKPEEYNEAPGECVVAAYWVKNEDCEPNRQMVVCPFNPAHRLKQSKLASHILKCEKNYPNHNKVRCFFSVLEYIDKDKIDEHLQQCPHRTNVAHVNVAANPSVGVDHIQVQNCLTHWDNIDKEENLEPEISPKEEKGGSVVNNITGFLAVHNDSSDDEDNKDSNPMVHNSTAGKQNVLPTPEYAVHLHHNNYNEDNISDYNGDDSIYSEDNIDPWSRPSSINGDDRLLDILEDSDGDENFQESDSPFVIESFSQNENSAARPNQYDERNCDQNRGNYNQRGERDPRNDQAVNISNRGNTSDSSAEQKRTESYHKNVTPAEFNKPDGTNQSVSNLQESTSDSGENNNRKNAHYGSVDDSGNNNYRNGDARNNQYDKSKLSNNNEHYSSIEFSKTHPAVNVLEHRSTHPEDLFTGRGRGQLAPSERGNPGRTNSGVEQFQGRKVTRKVREKTNEKATCVENIDDENDTIKNVEIKSATNVKTVQNDAQVHSDEEFSSSETSKKGKNIGREVTRSSIQHIKEKNSDEKLNSVKCNDNVDHIENVLGRLMQDNDLLSDPESQGTINNDHVNESESFETHLRGNEVRQNTRYNESIDNLDTENIHSHNKEVSEVSIKSSLRIHDRTSDHRLLRRPPSLSDLAVFQDNEDPYFSEDESQYSGSQYSDLYGTRYVQEQFENNRYLQDTHGNNRYTEDNVVNNRYIQDNRYGHGNQRENLNNQNHYIQEEYNKRSDNQYRPEIWSRNQYIQDQYTPGTQRDYEYINQMSSDCMNENRGYGNTGYGHEYPSSYRSNTSSSGRNTPQCSESDVSNLLERLIQQPYSNRERNRKHQNIQPQLNYGKHNQYNELNYGRSSRYNEPSFSYSNVTKPIGRGQFLQELKLKETSVPGISRMGTPTNVPRGRGGVFSPNPSQCGSPGRQSFDSGSDCHSQRSVQVNSRNHKSHLAVRSNANTPVNFSNDITAANVSTGPRSAGRGGPFYSSSEQAQNLFPGYQRPNSQTADIRKDNTRSNNDLRGVPVTNVSGYPVADIKYEKPIRQPKFDCYYVNTLEENNSIFYGRQNENCQAAGYRNESQLKTYGTNRENKRQPNGRGEMLKNLLELNRSGNQPGENQYASKLHQQHYHAPKGVTEETIPKPLGRGAKIQAWKFSQKN